jgi:hypothetical protein
MKRIGGKPSDWFVGVRLRERLHPYDEQHFEFPTQGWIWLEANSPLDAQFVVRYFVREVGANGSPQQVSTVHKQVFAYRKGNL